MGQFYCIACGGRGSGEWCGFKLISVGIGVLGWGDIGVIDKHSKSTSLLGHYRPNVLGIICLNNDFLGHIGEH